ncbi:hypothetical protein DL96DRAFT_1712920 [Flagelloscypha sp. PMI_526]|nr:hypothetical protein DL96DRAFT_1712920 [Flagelloscypha sp. PMI_526]
MALTIAFKRDECIIIDKVLLIAAPLVNNFQFWEYSNLDIQVELQGLDALTPDLEEPALNPSAIVLEHVRDIVESVEHFVLLEVPENRAGSSLPSLVPWIEALSTSKTLKQLDTKLALCLQPLAWFLDQWRLQRLDGDDGPMSFPSLEHLIIREVRFCLPPPESLESPTTPSLPLVNEQVGDDTCNVFTFELFFALADLTYCNLTIPVSKSYPRRPVVSIQTLLHPRPGNPIGYSTIFSQAHFFLLRSMGLDFLRVFRELLPLPIIIRTLLDAVEWDGIDSIFWDPWLPPSSPAPPLAGDQTSSDESEEEL